jgi:glucokinase
VEPGVNQSIRLAVALDVGGTTVRSAIVSAAGDVAQVDERHSPSQAPANDILDALASIISDQTDSAPPGYAVEAVGIAMPAPFNYERGVSLMEHKFAALRGMAVGELLVARLGLPLAFVNDADGFALGAWWGEHRKVHRFLGVTIGTGVGSGFLVNGVPAHGLDGAPDGGEVWNLPFQDGTVEDVVSAGAVVRAYHDLGGSRTLDEAAGIAGRAQHGDQTALAAFARLGKDLGSSLAEVTLAFRPERVVVGGAVARSFPLFGPQAEGAYSVAASRAIPFTPSAVDEPALLGSGLAALGVVPR